MTTLSRRKKSARRITRSASAKVLVREANDVPRAKARVRVLTDVTLVAITTDGRPHIVVDK